jgi:threonine/homoserine/homoserine lactone efflux protein
MAVVTEAALQRGRSGALSTVVGINIANSSLALASMLGFSAALHQWPELLRGVRTCGVLYLAYLGLMALYNAGTLPGAGDLRSKVGRAGPGSSAVVRGILTNWLNPSVLLFYMLVLPQFISATDPFVRRFSLLAATHISMSLLWLSSYALAVGTLSERLERPWVRRSMAVLTGSVLVILAARLLFSR